MEILLHRWAIMLWFDTISRTIFDNKKRKMENIPVNKMYEQRHKFIIVALTGITGSGCSDFAELMHSEFIKDAGNGWGNLKKA